MTDIQCKRCDFSAPATEYDLATGVYNDIKCPSCGSTNNDHNTEYQRNLMADIKKVSNSKESGV